MKKLLLTLFVFVLTISTYAQKIDPELLNDLKARNIGPGGMSGRVTAIAAEPGNSAILYIGTASGGIWKSENKGVNFEPIFDEEEVAGIGSISVDPNNPDVIWVGTGEGNPRNSITGGYGIYKSIDGGRSWNLMGLENTRHIHRLIVHPTNSDIIYVGAIGSPWGAHKERGVYKTTDGGKSWNQILFVNELTGVADMVIDPENPNKLFVAMWEHIRHPWFFKSGGEGSALHITLDGGDTWKKISEKDGFPKGELGRIGLAISKSNPEYVYALVESKKNAIYRSEDGGFTWAKRGDKNIGDRPFYYAEIYVDPTNENRVYSLYSRVNVSDDGAKTFRTLVGNNIHSDHHAWWMHPEDPSFMIDGNDGGMAITFDKGENWRHVTNLPVSQFYHISVDNDLPYNVYGGMQDNGSWKGPGYVWSRSGIINEYWDFLQGGDGFDVAAVPADSKYCYSMSQGGSLRRFNTETGQGINIQPSKTDTKLRFHWNAALSVDPFDGNTVYYGSQFLHKSKDRGDSWSLVSPDLTTNDTSRQKYGESGGLSYDVTGAETYTCILAIAPSAAKEGVIWVGTDDGNIQLTQNGGESWTNTSGKIKGYPDRPWVPQIKASAKNPGEAFVVVNNYRQNDYEPYLFHTENYGKSWERMVDAEDVPGYVLSFVQDPVEPKLMFLGTEYGLYVSINAGDDWVKWKKDFPTVSTIDMAIQEREADLVIGTFGRSAYVIDDIRPLRMWAQQGDDFKESKIQVFNPSTAYMVSPKNAPGYYFHGDAYFMGENRPMGAMVSYYTKDGKCDANKDFKKDSVLLKIMDSEGKDIRTMQFVPDKGINRLYWHFDLNGYNLDFGSGGRRGRGMPPRANKYPGGGGYAMAGTYNVRMIFQGDSSEVELVVKPDPRVEYDFPGMLAKQAYVDEVHVEMKAFNEKVKVFNTSKTQFETIQKLAKTQADDSLKASIRAIKKQFDYFSKELNGAPNVKQGIYEDEDVFFAKIMSLRYLSYMNTPITENQKVSFEEARKVLLKMDEKLTAFIESDWTAFKHEVETAHLSLFAK